MFRQSTVDRRANEIEKLYQDQEEKLQQIAQMTQDEARKDLFASVEKEARGDMARGDSLTTVSVIGSEFTGRILAETTIGETPAIVPELSGRGWITGVHQHMLDPDDPWPGGYRLSDTWGAR